MNKRGEVVLELFLLVSIVSLLILSSSKSPTGKVVRDITIELPKYTIEQITVMSFMVIVVFILLNHFRKELSKRSIFLSLFFKFLDFFYRIYYHIKIFLRKSFIYIYYKFKYKKKYRHQEKI